MVVLFPISQPISLFTLYFLYVQTLQKKDREDQSLPEMPHFLTQISAAYQDPALAPSTYSSHHNGLREPLIPVAEVRE